LCKKKKREIVMGKFLTFCNLILLGLMAFWFINDSHMRFDEYLIIAGISLLAVLNIVYIHSDANEESLLNLWIKTKKKKLKDELDK
jgi:hypothetical protein